MSEPFAFVELVSTSMPPPQAVAIRETATHEIVQFVTSSSEVAVRSLLAWWDNYFRAARERARGGA